MSWLSSFFVGVLTSVVTAVAGGIVAAGCVNWYRISAAGGESGFFLIGIVLLSCLAGFVGGLILSRFFGGLGLGGFCRGCAISSGAMLGLAAAGAGIAWSLADIPPTIKGRQLDLMVEIRLPQGVTQPRRSEGNAYIVLESAEAPGKPARARQSGMLDLDNATEKDCCWVLPGSVFLFTTRGHRLLTVVFHHKATHFELPFPPHPDARYEQWSEWLQSPTAPKRRRDEKLSYRFRVQPREPQENAADIDRKFAALSPDAPLDEWFRFLTHGRNTGRDQAIARAVEARPAGLASFLRSPDYGRYSPALYVVNLLKTMDPQVVQAMRDMAAEMEGQIGKLNAMTPQQSGYAALGNDIRNRFLGWSNAWGNTCEMGKVDCRMPVEAIARLAAVHKDSGPMQEVIMNAQALLNNLPAVAAKP